MSRVRGYDGTVESRTGEADKGATQRGYSNRVVVADDQTILHQRHQPGQGGDQSIGGRAVPVLDVPEMDNKVAHQPFDNVGAAVVVGRHPEPAGNRKVPFLYCSAPVPFDRVVLHITFRSPADR